MDSAVDRKDAKKVDAKWEAPVNPVSKAFKPDNPPIDSEGYCQSFKLDDADKIREFWDRYGFVVIDEVLPKEHLDATVNEIWDSIEERNGQAGINIQRNNPGTWCSATWPDRSSVGLLTSRPTDTPWMWANRQHPNIYKAYATLFKHEHLLVQIDRVGVMRPTRKIRMKQSELELLLAEEAKYTSKKKKAAETTSSDVKDAPSMSAGQQPSMNAGTESSMPSMSTQTQPSMTVSDQQTTSSEPATIKTEQNGNANSNSTSTSKADSTAGTANEAKDDQAKDKDLLDKNSEIKTVLVDRPEWKTASAWFHWDMNPWLWYKIKDAPRAPEDPAEGWARNPDARMLGENNDTPNEGFDKMQGLVALLDAKIEDGGFQIIPGFHKVLEEWAQNAKYPNSMSFIGIDVHEPFLKYAFKVAMRRGSMVIWSSRMPHCNYPNDSSQWRMCQYIKMFPALPSMYAQPYFKIRTKEIRARLKMPKGQEVTPLGKKIFGIEKWTEKDKDSSSNCSVM